MFPHNLALSGVFALMGSTAMAACAFQNAVPPKSLSAGFEVWNPAGGAIATATANPYPSTTTQGLMHGAPDNQLQALFTGETLAADTLAAVEVDHAAAKEAGLFK